LKLHIFSKGILYTTKRTPRKPHDIATLQRRGCRPSAVPLFVVVGSILFVDCDPAVFCVAVGAIGIDTTLVDCDCELAMGDPFELVKSIVPPLSVVAVYARDFGADATNVE
jgi:hypothetical protein